MAKDRKGPKISYQVLHDSGDGCERRYWLSYLNYGTDRFLTRAFMKYGWDLYAPDAKTRDNPYVSPLRAKTEQLKELPPALVITAENDPLRDEGEAYARKLKEAGVEVTAVRYNGTIHDFVALNALRNVPSTEAALEQINEGLKEHLKAENDLSRTVRDAAGHIPPCRFFNHDRLQTLRGIPGSPSGHSSATRSHFPALAAAS